MVVRENGPEGAIITDSERYFIQPARSLSKNAKGDEFVFYSGSDVAKEAGTCGVTLAEEVAAQEARASSQSKAGEIAETAGPVTALSPLRIIRIATDADAEYVAALGGASQANTQILDIMNMVDGIYQVEIGLTFQIVFQNTWTDANTDPYTSTAPSTLLAQFRNYWNANFSTGPASQRSVAHLWTGKDLDGSIIGVASLAVVCRTPQSAYGLSQRFPVNASNPITAQTVVLTAHEIGHNFSAAHTNQTTPEVPPDIEQPCGNTIMEATIGNGSNFCPFSRSQIIGHANAYGSCLLDSSSGPPAFPACVETPIVSAANGTLATSDCRAPERGVRFFAHQYSFNATAGQQVTITMNKSSGNLDPYLYLIGPDGYVIVQDDDSNGNLNARIPSFVPPFTLPLTGKYIIEATSSGEQQTGDYTVNMSFAGCTLSVNPTSRNFPVNGGIGAINVTTSGSCTQSYQFLVYPNTSDTAWLQPQDSAGFGSRALNFNVQANSNAAGRRAFLLVGATGYFGGLRIPITQSGTGPDCSLTPIAFGQTINGNLTTSSCQSPVRGNGYYTDRYAFTASAGQHVAISLSSTNAPTTDTFLTLIGPNGAVILTDDDSGGFTNSRIPGGTGMLTLGLPGTYIIEAGTFDAAETGPYTLTLTSDMPPILTLLTEEGTNQAVALDSVTQVHGPFRVNGLFNFSADHHTRVMLFTSNLGLGQGDDLSVISVQAQDASVQSYTLPIENVGTVPGLNQASYIVVRLTDQLPAGQLAVSVTLRGAMSNSATIGILP